MNRRWPLAVLLAAIAVVFLPVASAYVKRYSLSLPAAASIYACFIVFCFYVIAPALSFGRTLLQRAFCTQYKHLVLLVLLVLPYLLYATGTNDFRWTAILRLLIICIPVVGFYGLFPVRDASRFEWQDAIVAAWLVTVVLFQGAKGIWNVPVPLDFLGRLFIVSLGVFSWIYIRPVPGLGYKFDFSGRVLKVAVFNLALFTGISIPMGFALSFIAWNPRWHGSSDFLISGLEILLFIAILEETFFRGFLQNLFSNSLHSWWRGQLLASCLFGLFHVLHHPFPNWRYVILASVAGWFYGSAYRNGGTIFCSALVHASVDTLWRTFLSKS